MKNIKNDLGWYFNETRLGLLIRRKDPSKLSLRNRIISSILFLMILAIMVFWNLISKEGHSPEYAIYFAIVLILVFVIFGLLSKFWLLRILFINLRFYSLTINGLSIDKRSRQISCYLFKTEIEHTSEPELYRVYLKPSEFLEIEGPSEDFNPLVWESHSVEEANQIVNKLHECGVGETDSEKQHHIIKGNKKIGLLVLACYILCLFAMLFYIMPSTRSEIANNPDSIKPYLHIVQDVVIFGLLSFILYAAYKLWFGLRVIKYRQIPPPKTFFFVDTVLFSGDRAVKKGRTLIAIALTIIIICLIGVIYIPYKLNKVFIPQNAQENSIIEQNE